MQEDIDKVQKKINETEHLTSTELIHAAVKWIKSLQQIFSMTDKKQLKIKCQRGQPNPKIHTDITILVH